MSDKLTRTRNWLTIVYPDSCPENWTEKLADLHVPAYVSPLHDRDVNPNDNSPKKPHFHVILTFAGVKSYEQVFEMVKTFGGVSPQVCNNLIGNARYLIHKDNPDKAQYDQKDVQCFCGADYDDLILTSTDIKKAMRDMVAYIRDNNINYYNDFVDYCLDNKIEWFDIAVSRTMALKGYCISKATKQKDEEDVRRINAIPNRSIKHNTP